MILKNIKYISFWMSCLMVICSFSVSAQEDIYVDIQCSNQYPGVGEQIKLSYTLKLKMKGGMASISHNGIKIGKPAMKSLNIVKEGSEGNSFSFGGFGGDMQLSKYSFILQPTQKGKVTIDPLTFEMNGNVYKSSSYTINVGEGDPKAKIVPQNSNIFLRIDFSKSEIYKGEHALVTYKLYSHYTNISIVDYDFPMANGLWKEEIKQGSKGWPQTQETINGKGYLVVPLKKEIIYAQKTGEIEIPAISIDLIVGGGFFSQGTKESIKSNSPTIKVKPLPEGAPASFIDQVGKNYKLEMSYSTTELKSGEALDIKIKINGDGNIKQMTAPKLKLPFDFEEFEPEVKESYNVTTSGASGSKSFDFLVIPRHHGTFEIPEFKYTYFDLSSKKYKTLTYPSQTITVEKGANTQPLTTNSNITQKGDVEILNNEIRHISSQTTFYPKDTYFFKSKTFWIGIVAPPSIFVLVFLFLMFKPQKDENEMTQKGASKKALKILNEAKKHLDSKDDLLFYESLYKGLLHYLSNKFSVPTSSLTKESISATLVNHNIDLETINSFIKIIEESEMARFAPITHAGAENTMNQAVLIIQNIEKNAK